MAPIPLAILGTGIFARTSHLPALLPLLTGPSPNFSLVAIYSRSLSSAQNFLSLVKESIPSAEADSIKLYHDADPQANVDALLARDDLKAVLSVLPIDSQPEVIRKALSKGKKVLSEKPVAPSVKDGEALIEWYEKEAKTKGASWTVAENYVWEEAFKWAGEKLKEGRVGTVRGLELYSAKHVAAGSNYHATSWRTVPSYQGGFVFDGGVHWPALFRALFSPLLSSSPSLSPTRVATLTRQHESHLPPVDTVRSLIQFTGSPSPSNSNAKAKGDETVDGVWTDVYATRGGPSRALVEIIGDKGVLEIYKASGEHRGYRVVLMDAQGKKEEEKEFGSNGVEEELKAWAGLVEREIGGGGKGTERRDERERLVEPRETLRDVEVIEAMLKSGERNGEWIEIGRE